MKTKKEGLKEAYKRAGHNAYFGEGFDAGIRFAQRWISVKECLPSPFRHGFSQLVLTKDSFGKTCLEKYDHQFSRFTEKRYDAIKEGDGQVSHWRPIEIDLE